MKSTIKRIFFRFLREEDGPTAVEYAVMLAAILMVCLAAITSVGGALDSQFQDIETKMPQ
jgi:pilus assembly protein Flp/PilA